MKIVVCHFPAPDDPYMYARMLRAMRNSVAANFPEAELVVVEDDDRYPAGEGSGAANPTARQSFRANTKKMRLWERAMQDAEDGEVIAFLDADLLVLGDLSGALPDGADMAMTWRPQGAKFPFNSGVVFARASEETRAFFRRWREVNDEFLENGDRHQEFRARYGGINQAALGAMLEDDLARDLRIAHLPCAVWNCEDSTWSEFSGATRIVHIKGRLRKSIFRGAPASIELRPMIALWHHYEISTTSMRPASASPFRRPVRKEQRWDVIAARIPEDRQIIGVEVGVWRGENAEGMLRARPNLYLSLIDPYRTGEPGTPWMESGSTMPSRPQSDYDAALEQCLARIEPYADRATIVRRPSVDAAADYQDASIDFAYLDGDHSYEGCLADIRAWWPKVRPGGWIGGHDYARAQRGGVAEAVAAFFQHLPEVDAHATWFVRKPE